MSDDEWDKDREVFEAATEGPWSFSNWGDGDIEVLSTANGGSWLPILFRTTSHGTEADARFIARSRTRWPICDEERRRLLEELEWCRSAFDLLAADVRKGPMAVRKERDQLRAENERLRAILDHPETSDVLLAEAVRHLDGKLLAERDQLRAEVERIREELSGKTDIEKAGVS